MTIALRGITWDHPRGLAALVALGPRSGPRGDIVVGWSARSLKAFGEYPLERLVNDYDLLVVDHPHVPLAAEAGLLVPLDSQGRAAELGLLGRQSVGPSFASYGHGGHQWALPIDAAAQVSVYRPDLIGEPPQDWGAVLELAHEGRARWAGKPIDALSSFLTLSAQRGARVCDLPGRFVERGVGMVVLNQLHHFSELVGGRCLSEDPVDVAEALSRSEQWCYAPLVFGYVNYSRPGFRPYRLGYVDLPRGKTGFVGSCLGGAGVAVSARSAHREAAVECAYWLASAEVQRTAYYWAGGQPANALAWEDEDINADCLGFFSGTRRTLEGASVRPRLSGWMVLQERAGKLVHRALRRELSDQACLEQLDREAEVLLGDSVLHAHQTPSSTVAPGTSQASFAHGEGA